MGAQHTIIRLREENEKLIRENAVLKADRARAMRVLLGDQWTRFTTDDMLNQIQALQEYPRMIDGKVETRIMALKEENARLWYIVRMVLEDGTLQPQPAQGPGPGIVPPGIVPFTPPGFEQ